MSRSYKKFPLCRMTLLDHKSMKWGKTYANRKIRRKLKDPNFEVGNGHYYKFLGLDTYELYEFAFHETLRDVIKQWESDQKDFLYGHRTWRKQFTLEETINDWKKSYIRK